MPKPLGLATATRRGVQEELFSPHPHAEAVTPEMLHCRAWGHTFPRDTHWFREANLEPGMPELARKDMACACGLVKTRWMNLKTYRDWGEARYTYPPGYLQTDAEAERAVCEDYRAEDLRRDLGAKKKREPLRRVG